jgi:hypothetical protein
MAGQSSLRLKVERTKGQKGNNEVARTSQDGNIFLPKGVK